jgi:5-formyltetrahydrofolate cyclo-ligase
VGAYYSIGTEVRTEGVLEAARKMGKSVSLPRLSGEKISFFEFSDETDLVPGEFGILEPNPRSAATIPEVLVVPGIAFDSRGYRLGYGKGYYDRYLSEFPTYSIGLAFSIQIVDKIPNTDHDVPLNALATEKGITVFS